MNYDIFHFRAAIKSVGIWAFISRVLKKKKFVFTISHISLCMPTKERFSLFFYKSFKYCLKKADTVIVLTEYMKKELFKNYGINSIVIKSGHPIPKGPFKKSEILPF